MASQIYFASSSGSSNENLHSWDGTVFAATGYAPRYIAGPWLSRYVIGHFTSATATPSGANGTASTLWFSDGVSATLTFGSSDWIEVDPENGESITGIAVWRELVFVAKRSRLYVFYGTSTDATGSTIFNYRPVSLPSRVRVTSNQGGQNIIAAGDGVYLLCDDGLYKTTGDTPIRVSDQVTPLFDGTGDSSTLFPTSGSWTFGYASNRVYLSYAVGGNERTLVYDTILQNWLLWDLSVGSGALPTNVIAWQDANGTPTSYYAVGSKFYSLTGAGTTDDGVAISSSYQGSYVDLGSPDMKVVRSTYLEGSGTVTFGWATLGHRATTPPTASLAMPAFGEIYYPNAARGSRFSPQITATGVWALNRIKAQVG